MARRALIWRQIAGQLPAQGRAQQRLAPNDAGIRVVILGTIGLATLRRFLLQQSQGTQWITRWFIQRQQWLDAKARGPRGKDQPARA